MSDLAELYQELILDHNKRPRNRGTLAEHDHEAEGYNPICGDRVTITLILKDDVVEDIRFDGTGCAISTASASLMTEHVKGKTAEEVEEAFERFHQLVTGNPGEVELAPELGKLVVFSGVCEYPVRVKCATLAWHTLIAALADRADTVTTE